METKSLFKFGQKMEYLSPLIQNVSPPKKPQNAPLSVMRYFDSNKTDVLGKILHFLQ